MVALGDQVGAVLGGVWCGWVALAGEDEGVEGEVEGGGDGRDGEEGRGGDAAGFDLAEGVDGDAAGGRHVGHAAVAAGFA